MSLHEIQVQLSIVKVTFKVKVEVKVNFNARQHCNKSINKDYRTSVRVIINVAGLHLSTDNRMTCLERCLHTVTFLYKVINPINSKGYS